MQGVLIVRIVAREMAMLKNEYNYGVENDKSILVLRLRRYAGGLRKSAAAFASALTDTGKYTAAIVGQILRLVIVAFSNTFKVIFKEVSFFIASLLHIIVQMLKAPFQYIIVPILKAISEQITGLADAAEER